MRIEWNATFFVGVEQIDLQHQELFVRINQLLESSEAGKLEEIHQTINFLQDYVLFHFADEEKAMADHGYPQIAAHKTMHAAFREQFEALKGKLLRGDRDVGVTAQTKAWLVDWWTDHIHCVDREMAAYLIRHPVTSK